MKGAGWLQYNLDYPSFPSGATPSKYKVTSTNTSLGLREETGSSNRSWDTWYNDPTEVILDGNTGCRIYLKNDTSQYITATVTITFEYTVPYTAVVQGDKILATDRSQTGTTTTQGAVMTDTHFTAGTKITATDFNTTVLGL